MKKLQKKFTVILSLLTIWGSTNAQINYTNINPDCESTMSSTIGAASNLCPIDFDNNATIEYKFRWDDWSSAWFMHMTYGTNCEIALNGTTTNLYGGRFIKPLQLNDVINSSLTWGVSTPEPFIGETTVSQNFLNLGDRYVGVKFKIGTNVHYGWVLVNFQSIVNARKIIVKSYAYHATPNTQILAGQTTATPNSKQEIVTKSIQIFPNPISDRMQIEGLDGNPFSCTIFNSFGQIVFQNENSSNTLHLEHLPTGVYSIQIIANNGMTFNKKIVKQ
jgi:hypothetical protein